MGKAFQLWAWPAWARVIQYRAVPWEHPKAWQICACDLPSSASSMISMRWRYCSGKSSCRLFCSSLRWKGVKYWPCFSKASLLLVSIALMKLASLYLLLRNPSQEFCDMLQKLTKNLWMVRKVDFQEVVLPHWLEAASNLRPWNQRHRLSYKKAVTHMRRTGSIEKILSCV